MSETETKPEPKPKETNLKIDITGLDDKTDPAVMKIIQQMQDRIVSLEKDKADAISKSDDEEKETLLKQIEKKGFKREEFKDESLSSLKSAMKILAKTPDVETEESDTLQSTDAPKIEDESFGYRDPVTKKWVTSLKSTT